jgi:hypothetical protein
VTQTMLALEPWTERAWTYLERLAPGDRITAESLRRAVGEPEEANALGAVFRRASKKGLLRYGGAEERAERHAARGRWVRVWERT